MRKVFPRQKRFSIVTALVFLLGAFSTQALALPTHTLLRGQWSLISLPADPGAAGSIESLFGDDLPAADYGAAGQWVIYGHSAAAGALRELALTDSLSMNTAYWIMQSVADSVDIDLPDTLTEATGSKIPGCPTNKLCIARSLQPDSAAVRWHLVGFSSIDSVDFGDTRFVSANSDCAAGCSPGEALAAGVANSILYRYKFASQGSSYERVTPATPLQPWEGYLLAVFPGSDPVQWVLPVGDDVRPEPPPPISPPPVTPPPNPDPTDTELDAARLLMQASFGPTDEAIDEVLRAGGPVAWVDAQIELPASQHLPGVKALFPNVQDKHHGRYQTFYKIATSAEDQLRQRMALALSEIFVISDRSPALRLHGNMAAAYYDVLVNGAFGNFRDLLENVTLSPAMGIYLSMMGNDKPDVSTGRRADENYAREMMQLFSIGLVRLNLDGTERQGANTYLQVGVENLARVLTGWSWDVGSWKTSTHNGWKPNRNVMERPMVPYPTHHDVRVKKFMGLSLPAGQSAQQDLKIVLDRIFNHQNVGPFIGKQLIQRLVTSNPSRAYVRRVASTFDDNGFGVRGDLAAVTRAILLDPEARNPDNSQNPEFGKLREPILRYAHLFRATNVTDPLTFTYAQAGNYPQIAPLTAPSVFNFFTPDYAPPGKIADANLVAPEFQLNSETNLSLINRFMQLVLLQDRFLDIPTFADLSAEKQLLEDPKALVDHLNLTLTAGRLTSVSRQILTDYISSNQGKIDDERLVRDVVVLVVSSTEYATQR